MLRYLLDTSICVRILRHRGPAARARMIAESGAMAVSTVVLMELLVGAHKSARPAHNRAEVAALVALLDLLAFDAAAAEHAADIRAALERTGDGIGHHDTLIAGHARSRSLVVVTGNLGDFGRVAGLRAEDWPETRA